MAIDIGKGLLKISPDLSGFQADLQRSLPHFTAGLSTAAAGAALTYGVTRPLVNLGKQAIDSSIQFEQALAGVAKTVGDVTTIADPLIQSLGEELRAMSREAPIAAEEFARIGEIAGQLGVPAENITDFAKVVSDLAISTDLTTEAAAFSLARFATVLGEDAGAVREYSDSLIELGNNFATTESQIVGIASRIAGAGATVGLQSDEILALATALSSVGVRAEMGGTAISRVIVDIASAAAEGGDKLATFAEVTGMTSEEFARLMDVDPAQALLSFIQGLQQVQNEGAEVFRVLEDLEFGNVRVRDVLLRSAGAADVYEDALRRSSQAAEDGVATQNEVAKFMETAQSRIAIAGNNVTDALRDMGDSALPVIKVVADGISGLAQGMTKLPAPIKGAIGLIATLAGAVGPLLVTYGGFLQAAATLKLLKTRHQEAAGSALQHAAATDALAASLGRATAASGAAAGGAFVGSKVTSGPGAGGFLLNPAAAGAAVSARSGRMTAEISKKLRPSFKTMGKGLGIGFGASLIGGVVESLPSEEGSFSRALNNIVGGAISGAGIGATGGSLFGPTGLAIGAVGGALVGGIVGAFKDNSDEISDSIDDSIRQIPAEVEQTATQAGVEIGLQLQDGFVKAGDEVHAALDEWRERFQDAWGETQSALTQYARAQPSIFAPMFDEEGLKALLEGVPAQFSETGELIQEAVPPLSWEDVVDPVAADIALMEELGGLIDEFTDDYNLAAISTQLAEGDPTEALARAKLIKKQLLEDPESVFQLEADILRLKPGLDKSLENFLSMEALGDPARPLFDRVSPLLTPEDAEELAKTLYDPQPFIDGLVREDRVIAEQLAEAWRGPIQQGLVQAIETAFLGETQFDPSLIADAIAGIVVEDSDIFGTLFQEAIRGRIGEGGVVVIDGVPVRVTDWDIDLASQDILVNGQPIAEGIASEITSRLKTWAEGGALQEIVTEAMDQGIEGDELSDIVEAALREKNIEITEDVFGETFPTVPIPMRPEILWENVEEDPLANFIDLENPLGLDIPLRFFVEPAPEHLQGALEAPDENLFGERMNAIYDASFLDGTEPSQSFADSYIQGFAERMEIRSPSGVFLRLGESLLEGLNLGMSGQVGDALLARIDFLIATMYGKGYALSQQFLAGVNAGLGEVDTEMQETRTKVSGSSAGEGDGGVRVQTNDKYELNVTVNGTKLDTTQAVGEEVGMAIEKWLSRRGRERVL